ncbi:MAG: ThuA domain-containing protein [Reichenbachiella sp.]
MRLIKLILPIILVILVSVVAMSQEPLQVMVFSKTNGWRHKSIEKGQESILEWAKKENWNVRLSEDSLDINDVNLEKVDVLLFLNTTGDVLGEEQQQSLIRFINQGGGFVGIHSAVDTEVEWDWYNQMIGGRFKSHPKQQVARAKVNHTHPAVDHLGDSLITIDEWYNYKEPIKDYVNVILELDEKSYEGGEMGHNHPLSWYHYFEGGRVFYTGMGHRKDTYENPDFITHVVKGINWVGGNFNLELGSEWVNLLDEDLSQWVKFMGVPHTSVDIDGVFKSDDAITGTPLGLNNDPTNVFSVKIENKEPVLEITGEVYGGLTTRQEYSNYHFKTQFKWGTKKWEPRLDEKMDNGILYHCNGPHGTFWNVWMHSLECQVQETDMGDFIALGDVYGDVSSDKKVNDNNKTVFVYNPKGELMPFKFEKGYEDGRVSKSILNENPKGEWNTIEVICVGTTSMHIINGKVVNVVINARYDVNGKTIPIDRGKIQLQSEAAEAYYKDMKIKSVSEFPKKYKKQAKL